MRTRAICARTNVLPAVSDAASIYRACFSIICSRGRSRLSATLPSQGFSIWRRFFVRAAAATVRIPFCRVRGKICAVRRTRAVGAFRALFFALSIFITNFCYLVFCKAFKSVLIIYRLVTRAV